ncbi:MAG: hypothetical protein GC147_01155 [Porphyrobacter sp.]|nr:hypothetical protein [Porphyrobacter sp.]
MCLRISSALVLSLLLAACGKESPPPPGEAVDCAIGPGAAFSPVCTLERVGEEGEFVLHGPDGGFRRLRRGGPTAALAPLDGADPLVPEESAAGVLQFAIGADRYRIPRALIAAPAR